MRLWTLHPCYLDPQGLVALWREALLAQKVLLGHTKGYQHHPQLHRFRAARNPLAAIATYLAAIHAEATRRGYQFDVRKIARPRTRARLPATKGQLLYEWQHLQRKLRRRSPAHFQRCRAIKTPTAHSLFRVVIGEIETWERTSVPTPKASRGT